MDNPKWPESLPPPTEVNIEDPKISFVSEDLDDAKAIKDLAHDLYWYDNSKYFLYFEYDKGPSKSLHERLLKHGIGKTKRENFFYRHPKPAYKNDFVRILPHSNVPYFLEGAKEGKMYGRFRLRLLPDYRKQLDFRIAANETSKVLQEQEPIIEIKPGVWGVSINLKVLYNKIVNLLRR